jgi:hypothetical protein
MRAKRYPISRQGGRNCLACPDLELRAIVSLDQRVRAHRAETITSVFDTFLTKRKGHLKKGGSTAHRNGAVEDRRNDNEIRTHGSEPERNPTSSS